MRMMIDKLREKETPARIHNKELSWLYKSPNGFWWQQPFFMSSRITAVMLVRGWRCVLILLLNDQDGTSLGLQVRFSWCFHVSIWIQVRLLPDLEPPMCPGNRPRTPRWIPKIYENVCPQKTCAWMLTMALFIIAKQWKQAKCPSSDEWINKM